jgi:hypothetical protein
MAAPMELSVIHSSLFRKQTFAILALLLCEVGCTQSPPAGVPANATRVLTFGRRGGWAYCWFDHQEDVNRCRIYNASGQRLLPLNDKNDPDDVYLKYEGSGPVRESELQINPELTGSIVVWLRNGVALIPRSDYDVQKRFLDDLRRVTKQ